MNYFEHRLREIREQIDILSTRKDTQQTIQQLKQERQTILKNIQGETK